MKRNGGAASVAVFLMAVFAVGLCSGNAALAQSGSVPTAAVSVVKAEARDVTPFATFTGRIVAPEKVDLRARVEGFIEQRLFDEGADVEVGQRLFVLDKAPYEARVAEAEGAVVKAESALRLAQITLDRQKALLKRQVAAQARVDDAATQVSEAQGELARQRAILQKARLDLSYAEILAPISGRIGRAAFSVGSFVGPSSGALATIVSQDPIYVTFPVSQRDLLAVRHGRDASGRNTEDITVGVRLADGSLYPERGSINFVDVSMDPGTDTLAVRATLPNPGRLLYDGQLVNVIVEVSAPRKALLIPQQAVQIDQQGRFVLVVGAENKVEVRRIVAGEFRGELVVVEQGLVVGDRVIIEGIQKVRQGGAVVPTEVPLPASDLDGLL